MQQRKLNDYRVQSVQMFRWLLCLLYVLYPAVACVQSVQMFQKLSCLPYVFDSVLVCAKSADMFQKLSYSLCGICLSVSSLITLPQTVTLFYVSLRYQAPQRQCTVLSFSSMRRHLFTCTTVLHCGHTFLRRIHLLNSIACTTVLHCTVGIPF